MKESKSKKNKKFSMKNLFKNNKGFSLIELMAIMIVVGALAAIAIASASNMIGRSKKEKVEQNKKNVTMAAKMYVQNNRDLLPRNIGEERIIKLSVLKDSNYLKETVTNDDGESCMNESLVRIYKLSNSEYAYTPFIYCGDEKAPPKVTVDGPEISDFTFSDSVDVSKATFSFKIKGNSSGTGEIYGYTYSILVKNNNTDYTEAFSSGTVSGNNKKVIEFTSKPLVEYIDITGFSIVKIRVTATNRDGGTTTIDSANYNGKATSFNDTIPPKCVDNGTIGAAKDDNDWISKENIDTEQYPRIISVKCTDGNGSGCKRDLFSDSWPDQKDYIFGTKFADIKIEDNAVMTKEGNIKEANSSTCEVKVNADVKSPSVKLTAFNPVAGKAEEKASLTVNEEHKKHPDKVYPEGTFKADSYVNQKGDTIKWLNAEHYPEGIKFNIEISDNLYAYKYVWETNSAYVRGGASNDEITANVSATNPDAAGEVILVPNTSYYEDKGKKGNLDELPRKFPKDGNSPKIVVSLKAEGMRYGRLRVYDKAGNYTTVHVYANIDRTAPPIPSTLYQKNNSKSKYTGNADWTSRNLEKDAWSTEFVFAYINGQQEDHESNNTELSGWKQFKYIYSKQNGITRNGLNVSGYTFRDSAETVCTDKDGSKKIGYVMKDQGTHTIKFRSCDKAENCSDYNNNKKYNPYPYVKIDTIAPKCDVKLDHPRGDPLCVNNTNSSSSSCGSSVTSKMNGWLGYKDDVRNLNLISSTKKIAVVSGLCTDINSSKGTDTTFASLCYGVDGRGKPTNSEILTIYNNYSKFPVVMQPYHKYDYEINTTTAGAAGNSKYGTVKDIAGNTASCSGASPNSYTVKIDYTRPTCKSSTTRGTRNGSSYDGRWLSGSEASSSPVVYSTWAVDSGSVSSGSWEYYSNYESKYNQEIDTVNATTNRSKQVMFDNGSYAYSPSNTRQTVRLYVYDKAGNRSRDICPTREVRIDKTSPKCQVDARAVQIRSPRKSFSQYSEFGSYNGRTSWVNADYKVVVRRKCMTDSVGTNQDPIRNNIGSGCTSAAESYDYYANSGRVLNAARGAAGPSSPGQIVDAVGNKTTCTLFSNVMIDDQKPTCSISSNSDTWVNASTLITVKTSCADGSGSQCDPFPSKGPDYYANKSHTYPANPGGHVKQNHNAGSIRYNYSGKVIDNVGNISDACPANKNVWIDDVKPKCAISQEYMVYRTYGTGSSSYSPTYYSNDYWTNKTAFIQGSCSDLWGSQEGSGCRTTSSQLRDSFGYDIKNDNYTYNHMVCDNVNNCSDCPNNRYKVRVQKTPPSCSVCTVSSSNKSTDTPSINGNENGVTSNYKCTIKDSNSAKLVSCSYSGGSPYSSSSFPTNSACGTSYYDKGGGVTAKDQAGNSTYCSGNVSSLTHYKKRQSTACNRCESAGCQTANYCTYISSWYNAGCLASADSDCERKSNTRCDKGDDTTVAKYNYKCPNYSTGRNLSKCGCETWKKNCSSCYADFSGISFGNWTNTSCYESCSTTKCTECQTRTAYKGSKVCYGSQSCPGVPTTTPNTNKCSITSCPTGYTLKNAGTSSCSCVKACTKTCSSGQILKNQNSSSCYCENAPTAPTPPTTSPAPAPSTTCSRSNPTACNWVTSCRRGNTCTFKTSANKNRVCGLTVHHDDRNPENDDKLYLVNGMNEVEGKVEISINGSTTTRWIFSNCLGQINTYCVESQCPDPK